MAGKSQIVRLKNCLTFPRGGSSRLMNLEHGRLPQQKKELVHYFVKAFSLYVKQFYRSHTCPCQLVWVCGGNLFCFLVPISEDKWLDFFRSLSAEAGPSQTGWRRRMRHLARRSPDFFWTKTAALCVYPFTVYRSLFTSYISSGVKEVTSFMLVLLAKSMTNLSTPRAIPADWGM